MRYTDQTIPIECPEHGINDGYIAYGLDDLLSHIFENHLAYSNQEACQAALKWLENAWERVYDEEAAYNKDRAYEKAVRGIDR